MQVFLTGGSGFVGSHMLPRLLRDGHDVRALVRHRDALASVSPNIGSLAEVNVDVSSPELATHMAGCDAVINLIGIIYEQGSATFEAVHHLATRNLVQSARSAGVKRFVQMSALRARPGNASAYHTSKFAAEDEVRGSGIPWTILRPSLIFGLGSAFVQQMVAVMGAAPFIRPVPGSGKYRFRPVHVVDVVECFVQSLTNPAATGQTVDLVGGEELTLDEMAQEIATRLGIDKIAVHVPMPIMRSAAAIFSLLPVKPPVTAIQLRMLREGSTADPEPMRRIFRIDPVGFREGLRRDPIA